MGEGVAGGWRLWGDGLVMSGEDSSMYPLNAAAGFCWQQLVDTTTSPPHTHTPAGSDRARYRTQKNWRYLENYNRQCRYFSFFKSSPNRRYIYAHYRSERNSTPTWFVTGNSVYFITSYMCIGAHSVRYLFYCVLEQGLYQISVAFICYSVCFFGYPTIISLYCYWCNQSIISSDYCNVAAMQWNNSETQKIYLISCWFVTMFQIKLM